MEDGAVQGRGRVGFRPPLTSVLPVAGVLVLMAIVLPSEGSVAFVIMFTFFFAILRLRQLLVLEEDRLEVTVLRTRRIPWADVQGFELVDASRGDPDPDVLGRRALDRSLLLVGGPAAAADIEALRREARARS